MSELLSESEIIFSVEDHVGFITLNRPKALNALTMPMFEAMYQQLKIWQDDHDVHAVVMQAPPEKIFCAGGDVRWVFDVGQNDPLVPMRLFKHEYRLNYLISVLGKPYISLMDGLTIGGGVGITLHGSHPVASERFAFMMPEGSIGFFPDIGSSYLLSACPGGFGLYLGLTGRRLQSADAYAMGLVKYTVPSEKFSSILKHLRACDLSHNAAQQVSICLESHQCNMATGSAAHEAAWVRDAFENKAHLSEVFEALEQQDTTWSRETKAVLLEQSPLSLHVTFEQLRRAKGLNLAECLNMDYGLTYHFLKNHDFYEGVRARLVDKDKSPKWLPATWQAVKAEHVAHYFEPCDELESLW
ncbi:MAG: enoyl-CoA hydratase/isomerase family protein [Legionella sp.]|jgi:enoyl-CoA hydratase/carnithine racemase|nr:enoyl-CoA hydratase/isomerase family protein [Legionella sp.]